MMDWYAIYVRSQAERHVAEHLRQRSIEHYLPLYSEHHRWADRDKEVEVPVFPGYVFGRFDDTEGRHAVLTSPGVVRILGYGSEPEPIPNSEIEAVRLLVTRAGEQRLLVTEGPPKGTRVKVMYGKFAGLEGYCRRVTKHYTIVVGIELLGRSIEFDLEDISVLKKVETRRDASRSVSPLPLSIVA